MNEDNALPEWKQETVIALYHETWSEITRLRDYEWKIAYYFLSLSAGMIALLCTSSFQVVLTPFCRAVFTAFQVAAVIFTIFYLRRTHLDLTVQRNVRRRIEDLFGFSEPRKCGKDSLLPQEWKERPITGGFQRMGLLVPLTIAVVLVWLLCLTVTWKVG